MNKNIKLLALVPLLLFSVNIFSMKFDVLCTNPTLDQKLEKQGKTWRLKDNLELELHSKLKENVDKKTDRDKEAIYKYFFIQGLTEKILSACPSDAIINNSNSVKFKENISKQISAENKMQYNKKCDEVEKKRISYQFYNKLYSNYKNIISKVGFVTALGATIAVACEHYTLATILCITTIVSGSTVFYTKRKKECTYTELQKKNLEKEIYKYNIGVNCSIVIGAIIAYNPILRSTILSLEQEKTVLTDNTNRFSLERNDIDIITLNKGLQEYFNSILSGTTNPIDVTQNKLD